MKEYWSNLDTKFKGVTPRGVCYHEHRVEDVNMESGRISIKCKGCGKTIAHTSWKGSLEATRVYLKDVPLYRAKPKPYKEPKVPKGVILHESEESSFFDGRYGAKRVVVKREWRHPKLNLPPGVKPTKADLFGLDNPSRIVTWYYAV